MNTNHSAADLKKIKSVWREHIADSRCSDAQITIGLASTFTIEPIIPYLGVSLLESGLSPRFATGPYNQIHQTCLEPAAAFEGVAVDCICIIWRMEEILEPDLTSWCRGEDSALDHARARLAELASLISGLAEKFDGSIIVSTPPYPSLAQTSISDLDNPKTIGFFHNQMLGVWLDFMTQLETVHVIDVEGMQRNFGLVASQDTRKSYLYRQPYTENFLASLAGQLARVIRAIKLPMKKCVAVDCDNTLWGGVIGEDGLAGIQLGQDFPGSAFRDFQKLLLHWKDRGVMIVLLSKNNEDDVWEVFNKHDSMELKRSDIAAWRIDWNPKAANLKELADELNIGIDSFVFIDDSPFEIEQMQETYAGNVVCFQIPEESARIVDQLKSRNWFDTLSVSDEDKKRTEMMASERERATLNQSLTHEEFIASLELEINVFTIGEEHLGRVTQLINKTNQFNLTTIRRTEDEVRALINSDKSVVCAAHVRDRFGDYGITGVAIATAIENAWDIDTFLLSCRVLGRGVETAVLSALAEHAKANGVTTFQGRFIPTAKNAPAKNFLSSHGFAESGDVLSVDIGSVPSAPAAVQIRLTQ